MKIENSAAAKIVGPFLPLYRNKSTAAKDPMTTATVILKTTFGCLLSVLMPFPNKMTLMSIFTNGKLDFRIDRLLTSIRGSVGRHVNRKLHI